MTAAKDIKDLQAEADAAAAIQDAKSGDEDIDGEGGTEGAIARLVLEFPVAKF